MYRLVLNEKNKKKLLSNKAYLEVNHDEKTVDFCLGDNKEDSVKVMRGLFELKENE